jgi:threonine/homoserine/homoserine lactone efflux protein
VTSELFLAFVAASTVLVYIPGPTVLLVVSYAMSQGRRSALATIAAVLLGDAVAMALAILGLGALLRSSTSLFLAMKAAGTLYLLYLGIRMWRAPTAFAGASPRSVQASRLRMAVDAFAVTVLNPHSGMFFVAFLPQFLEPERPLLPQMLLLGGTFLVLALTSLVFYALLAAETRRFARSPRVATWVNRLGAVTLVAAAVFTATLPR